MTRVDSQMFGDEFWTAVDHRAERIRALALSQLQDSAGVTEAENSRQLQLPETGEDFWVAVDLRARRVRALAMDQLAGDADGTALEDRTAAPTFGSQLPRRTLCTAMGRRSCRILAVAAVAAMLVPLIRIVSSPPPNLGNAQRQTQAASTDVVSSWARISTHPTQEPALAGSTTAMTSASPARNLGMEATLSGDQTDGVTAAVAYLTALATASDKVTTIRQVAAPGRFQALLESLGPNADLLSQSFEEIEATPTEYDGGESLMVRFSPTDTGQSLEVSLRWVEDSTHGGWKLQSIESVQAAGRAKDGNPLRQPTPSVR